MQTIRKDYQRNLAAMIPSDCPVFILRADDPLTLRVLTFYMSLFEVTEDNPDTKIYSDHLEEMATRIRMYQDHLQQQGGTLSFPAIRHEGLLAMSPNADTTLIELERALAQIVTLQGNLTSYRAVIADLQADKADTDRYKIELEQSKKALEAALQIATDKQRELDAIKDLSEKQNANEERLRNLLNEEGNRNNILMEELKRAKEFIAELGAKAD